MKYEIDMLSVFRRY